MRDWKLFRGRLAHNYHSSFETEKFSSAFEKTESQTQNMSPNRRRFVDILPLVTPGTCFAPFKCLTLPSANDDEEEQYLYYGPEPLDHIKKATQPEPSPCSTPLSSAQTDINEDFLEPDRSSEGSPRDDSCPSVATNNVLPEDTIHKSASDSTLTRRPLRPRSISMDYFNFNGWRRRGRRDKRNSTSEVAALRDQCVQDELGAAHLQRLYQSCGDLLAPLPISDPSSLLLRSPQTLAPNLKNKSGTLTDQEFKFYRNFAGVWRSDPARSEKTEQVYEMFNCSEFLKSEAKKVRNLSIHVKRCGLTTFAQASENLTVSESRIWDGVKPLKRRDGREGEAEGWLERYSQGIVLWSRWSDPFQATLCEYLELTADCMHLCLRLEVTTADEKTFNARIIWHRLLV